LAPPRKQYPFKSGESMREYVPPPGGGGSSKPPPYTMESARRVLRPKVTAVAEQMGAIPAAACPGGEAVAKITLHPRYIAKSAFPEALLASVGLRTVGATNAAVAPRSNPGEEKLTTELYVAGPRSAFTRLANDPSIWADSGATSADWVKVEDWSFPSVASKTRPVAPSAVKVAMLVALQPGGGTSADRVVQAFIKYASDCGAVVDAATRLDVGGLTYLDVEALPASMDVLAEFAFVRVIRGMPRLRLPMCGVLPASPAPFAVT